MAVALGLIIGGAIGNLSDRLVGGHHGQVVDFITLSHWPTFNVADACITAGVVVLIAATVLHRRVPQPGADAPPTAGDPAPGAGGAGAGT